MAASRGLSNYLLTIPFRGRLPQSMSFHEAWLPLATTQANDGAWSSCGFGCRSTDRGRRSRLNPDAGKIVFSVRNRGKSPRWRKRHIGPLWRYAIEQMAKLVGNCRIRAACEVDTQVSEFPRPRAHWKDYRNLMLDSIATSTRFAVSRNVAKVGICPASSDSYDIYGICFYCENA
jgi:hypothetical protein